MAEWSPYDFITRSTFCPHGAIRNFVDDVARALDLDLLLVLPFSDYVVFQSLLCVSGMALNPASAPHRLHSADFSFVTPVQEGQLLKDLSEFPALGKLIAKVEGFRQLASLVVPSDRVQLIGGDLAAERAKLLVLVRTTNQVENISAEAGSRILGMVNATQQVAVHQEHSPLSRVRSLLSGLHWVGPLHEQRDVALRELLQLALEISDSAGAAFFVESHPRGSFECQNWVANENGVRALGLSRMSESLLREGRPNITAQSALSVGTHKNWVLPHNATGEEILIPIQEMPGGQEYPHTSFLSVIRLEHQRQFGPYELSLLRNVSLRLSILQHGLDAESVAQKTATTIRTLSAQGVKRSHIDWSRPAAARNHSRLVEDNLLPPDVAEARADIGRVSQLIAAVSRCTSLTVRALCPPRGDEGVPSLRRAVVWPYSSDDEEDRVITISRSLSVNAWVALNGRPCYLPDVRKQKYLSQYPRLNYLDFRASTRSELCLPVMLDGWLVATVNLESSHVNNFALKVSQCALLAEMVGLSIDRARRQIAVALEDAARRADANVHTLHKVKRLLADETLASSDVPSTSVLNAFSYIDQILGAEHTGLRHLDATDLRPVSASSRGAQSQSFNELLVRSLSDVRLTREGTSRLKVDVDIRTEVADVVEWALRDIIQNVKSYLALDGRVSVQQQPVRLGGRELLLVKLSYPTSQHVERSLPVELYRMPVVERSSQGRTHLGSYIAGKTLRACGVEVYLARIGTYKIMITLAIPRLES